MTDDQRRTLGAQLEEHRITSSAKRSDRVNAAFEATAARLRQEGAVERALGVGASAPDFTLPNAIGKDVRLAGLLDEGPVVLAFYRGGW